MMRVFLYIAAVFLLVFLTWLAYVSIDEDVHFSELELMSLRLDGRRAVGAESGDVREGATGRVLVSFSWRAHSGGARCVSVSRSLKVGVGGAIARPVHVGGGEWVIGDVLPLPRHRCVNEAVYEVDRALLPGIVGASLGDGRGNPALISARDLVAPPALAVASPQPARAGERATLEVLPDTLAVLRAPLVQRGPRPATAVDVDGHRISFTVPNDWAPGAAPVYVLTHREATVLRCVRAPVCHAFGVPVNETTPFVIAPPP